MLLLEKVRSLWGRREAEGRDRESGMTAFRDKYASFQTLLASNTELLQIIADIEQKLGGQSAFGPAYIEALSMRTIFHTARMVRCLEQMTGRPYPVLKQKLADIIDRIKSDAVRRSAPVPAEHPWVLPYGAIRRDTTDLVGAKNANIGEVTNALAIAAPKGFAITTAAFRHFIRANDLIAPILRMKRKADLIEAETLVEVSEAIQSRILAAQVPDDLAKTILDAHTQLIREIGSGDAPANVSMRSSALGEDSTLSFAGQYLTVLNVPPQRILSEYKRILASLFSAHAIAYRLHMAITFEDAVMAVACQEMIDARASGVMFTRNPVNPLENRIIIDAVWGLGPYAVDGIVPPDTYILSKEGAPQLLSKAQIPKTIQLTAGKDGQVESTPVQEDWEQRSCLSDKQARQLAEIGLRLETYFGSPQDIEWALDRQGRLMILQVRPLRMHALNTGIAEEMAAPVSGHAVLVQGGEIACSGIGHGPVVQVRNPADAAAFPDGAVLVCPQASSQLVMAMAKASAILTDSGNVAGHMALLTREYMIPTILNLKNVSTLLSPGQMVTVDAYNGRVYVGRVAELVNAQRATTGVVADNPAYHDLRRRSNAIVPLNLKDPQSPDFTPANCRTIHDIMRFIHEKAYEEIFQLGDMASGQDRLAVRLDARLPLDLYVIDLGGGLAIDTARAHRIDADRVVSVPFAALLKGMLNEDLQSREPRPIHLGGFLSVMARQMTSPPNLAAERFGERSYAIVSDRYLNFSSRVGYHYSVLDCYCGKTDAKNYINFQFKGGAADDVRRGRRARMIETVLNSLGFVVTTIADRVTARLAKQNVAVLVEKLDRVGRLLIFTRQMDMLMHSDGLVEEMARCFLDGNYQLLPDGDVQEEEPKVREEGREKR
jgi:pyruvate, water dikinase